MGSGDSEINQPEITKEMESELRQRGSFCRVLWNQDDRVQVCILRLCTAPQVLADAPCTLQVQALATLYFHSSHNSVL